MYNFLGAITAIVLSLFWSAFWGGLTLSILWGWFISSLFDLPVLSVAQAFGVALCVKVANGIAKNQEKSQKSLGEQIAESAILTPVVAGMFLLTGYIAKSFI